MINRVKNIFYLLLFLHLSLFPLSFAITFSGKGKKPFIFSHSLFFTSESSQLKQLVHRAHRGAWGVRFMGSLFLCFYQGLRVNPLYVMSTDTMVTQPQSPRAHRSSEPKHCPPEPSNPLQRCPGLDRYSQPFYTRWFLSVCTGVDSSRPCGVKCSQLVT